MAENLIVRLEVAVDSVQRLVDSLDRGTQANAGRLPPLESLVRQPQHLLHRWEMLALRALSCTSVRPIRILPTPSGSNARVGRPAYNINTSSGVFKKQNEITWPQISSMLLVSRSSLWRRVRNIQSLSSRCYYTSLKDSDLDELIGEIRRGFPNSGISMMLGHLRSRNIYVQRQRVRESLVRTDPAGSAMRWFNTITYKACSQRLGT